VNYLSVCSGIEAATVAWHPLGWSPVGFAEIEAFPSAVLAHHYPAVPNLGDMTRFKEWPDATVDLLVGGTPCQSFSVAGLRAGIADPRGNLALVYLGIADRYRPEWLVWENVPGVLSSGGGADFGSIIGGMVGLGYCPAWRVLDAQFVRVDGFARAVPQRRRRVFVVAHLGDWRRSAAVLFEPESLRGDPPPRREAGKGVVPTISARPTGGGGLGTDFDLDGGLITSHDPAVTLTARERKGALPEADLSTVVAHALPAKYSAGDDGTGRGLPIIPALAFDLRGREGGSQFERPHDVAAMRVGSGGSSRSYVAPSWAVRRLTPTECERLQGFPDGYTAIPWRNKRAADGPRYKALGNSMAVNVMRWLGRRIDMVGELARGAAA
jgi:DNA (cytosine-5)-methyltransferase 1